MKISPWLVFSLFLVGIAHAEPDFYSPLADLDYEYREADIPALMQAAEATKAERVEHAFRTVDGVGLRAAFSPLLANLALGRDLDATNDTIYDVLTTDDAEIQERYRLNDHWCLVINQVFFHMYYRYGSQGTIAPGRLYPKTEKALLDVLWYRMKLKDDIHLTNTSTWWMVGSENHDLVSKVSSLITAQIFMHEPDYKDRVYPDQGTGGGNTYWFHRMYAEDSVDGPPGRGNDGDGKEYTAADHYKAWVAYFDEYFTERAKRGFFLEMASPGYMGVTLTHLMSIHDLCEDPELAAKAGDFLDVVWADWAIEQLNGVRGGSKTRVSRNSRRYSDSMYGMAQFFFGGKGNAKENAFTVLLSDYELKPIHWHLALDREGLGEFAFASRRPGAEEGTWPRPLGAERTMLCDTESRFLRYSWITPDYILGGQMDHPGAIHSHLSNQSRWQGVTFRGEGGPRVFPTDLIADDNGQYTHKSITGYMRMVQDRNVLIMQQARRYFQMNPCWFPAKDITSLPYGVYFGDNLDQVVEKDGWVFVQHGDAFLAVRPVMGEYAEGWRILKDNATPGLTSAIYEDSYDWTEDRTILVLKDKYAGIIFEASRLEHHASLDAFIEDVLDNPIFLDKTVVPGFHVLRYTGCGPEAKELTLNLSNSEIPFIGEERVDYEPDMLFDSPYFTSDYRSGVITIRKDEHELTHDFNAAN